MLSSEDVYKSWTFGVAEGLINKKGIYDNSPFLETLQDLLKPFSGFHRKIDVLLTNADKGRPEYFNESSDFKKIPEILTASISKGGELPFLKIDGTNYMSGLLVQSISIIKSIGRCIDEMNATEDDVVVDIISAIPLKNITKDLRKAKTLEMAARFFELTSFHKLHFALLSAKQSYPKAHFRYTVMPPASLGSSSMTTKFDAIDIMKLYQRGYADGMSAVADSGEAFTEQS
jgi:hypothetical protein